MFIAVLTFSVMNLKQYRLPYMRKVLPIVILRSCIMIAPTSFLRLKTRTNSENMEKVRSTDQTLSCSWDFSSMGTAFLLLLQPFRATRTNSLTLVPLEKRIIRDFNLSKFIVCTDAGLASNANRRFNNFSDRSYVVRQSLKRIPDHLKEWALNPEGWHLGSSDKTYDLNKVDDQFHKDSIFYKERWINENNLEQRLVVTFSPKYKHYQKNIRERQIERAEKIVKQGNRASARNQNSPKRFVTEIQMTIDGVIADKQTSFLDTEKIAEEEKYDGFIAVCTTLEDDVSEILKINRHRWEIEESFRIMKKIIQETKK